MKNQGSRRNTRRQPRSLVFGTTRAMPFEQQLAHQVLAIAVGPGINDFPYSFTALLSDLASDTSRVVRFVSARIRIYPFEQTTTAAASYTAACYYIDASSGVAVNFCSATPLSSVNMTTLNIRAPLNPVWQTVGSANNVFYIRIWAQSVLATGLHCDILSRFMLASDMLT